MYAIIQTGGKQYRVAQGDEIDVELLDLAEGQPVEFKEVLFVNNGELRMVGSPSFACIRFMTRMTSLRTCHEESLIMATTSGSRPRSSPSFS